MRIFFLYDGLRTNADNVLHIAHLHAVIRFHLFGSKPKGSFVTGSTANSNDNTTSISALQKACRDILHSGVVANVCLFVATVGAMLLAIWVALSERGWMIPSLLTTIAWPPLLHLFLLSLVNNWVPIAHLLYSPVYHSRDSRLVTTEQEISYPIAEVEIELSTQDSFFGRCCFFVVPTVLVGTLVGALLF